MTEYEISRHTLRNYGFDAVAIGRQLDERRKEINNLPKDEAKKISLALLIKAGLVDEFGEPTPPYRTDER